MVREREISLSLSLSLLLDRRVVRVEIEADMRSGTRALFLEIDPVNAACTDLSRPIPFVACA